MVSYRYYIINCAYPKPELVESNEHKWYCIPNLNLRELRFPLIALVVCRWVHRDLGATSTRLLQVRRLSGFDLSSLTATSMSDYVTPLDYAEELAVTFYPPLALQRRTWVFDILRREHVSEVSCLLVEDLPADRWTQWPLALANRWNRF